jgi:hypothetical protein
MGFNVALRYFYLNIILNATCCAFREFKCQGF